MVSFCLWLSAVLQVISTRLLYWVHAERPSRFCGFCMSPVCTACCRSVDGPSARGEFCSPRCRHKPKTAYEPGWTESSFTSGLAGDGDAIIRQAMMGTSKD
jgi:hypothetical protein